MTKETSNDKKRLIVLDDPSKPKHQQTLKSYLRSTIKLERSAIVYNDQVVKFGTPDNKELNRLLKEFQANGAKALKDFESWLIKYDGCTEEVAIRHRRWVWICLVLTHDESTNTSDLALILDNTAYSVSSMSLLKAALRRWGAYMQDANLLTQLHLHRRATRNEHLKKVKIPPKYEPYSDEEWKAILKSQNKWNQDPRYPWAWAVLGLLIKAGLRVNSELVFITRDSVVQALDTKALRIWSSSNHGRVIPTNLITKELQALIAFPANWDRLADLIAPVAKPDRRGAKATKKIYPLMHELFEDAGIKRDPKNTRLVYNRLRFTVALKLWQETENLIAVSNFLGYSTLWRTRRWLGSHIPDWVVDCR